MSKKKWYVVRLHEQTNEPEFLFGPFTKRDAKDVARSEDHLNDVDRHIAMKVSDPKDEGSMLGLARERGHKRRAEKKAEKKAKKREEKEAAAAAKY